MSSPLWSVTAMKLDAAWSPDPIPTIQVDLGSNEPSWPAIQPSPFDASSGNTAHRIVGKFALSDSENATLVLEFSSERAGCPDIEIELDGIHRGLFHPRVVRRERLTSDPGLIAGRATISVNFPSTWLTEGEHTLSITTVLDTSATFGGDLSEVIYRSPEAVPEPREHYGQWFGSYIRWHRVELLAGSESGQSVGTIQATPFYVEQSGALRELINVDTFWEAGTGKPTSVRLWWGDKSVPVPDFPIGRDFGMHRWRYPADDFETSIRGRLEGDNLLTFVTDIAPCRKWTLHLIPHVHLDLGFTDSQGKVLELHSRNIDKALDLVEGGEFKYSIDGSVAVQEYVRTRSADQIARLMRALTAGSISVNAFHSNFLTGLAGITEVRKSLSYSSTLPGGLWRYANITDVPTYSSVIPSVLASCGIRGFVGMSNHTRASTITSDELHLKSPVRWRSPDGSEVLAHFADHYSQLRFIAGDPQHLGGACSGIERHLERFERTDYLPNDLAIIGTHADNEDLHDGDASLAERWNDRFAYPRFRVSTFSDYLSAVDGLRSHLPIWDGEQGTFWEDGVGAAAAPFASLRRTQALLPAVETLGALISAKNPNLRPNRHDLDRAWNDVLIGIEHTMTWARSTLHPHSPPVTEQLEWKTRHIDDARITATEEARRLMSQLATTIGATGPGLLAYNPNPWTTDLDITFELAEGVRFIDPTVQSQVEVLSVSNGMMHCAVRLRSVGSHSYAFFPLSGQADVLPGAGGAGAKLPAVVPAAATASKEAFAPGWHIQLDPKTALPRGLRWLADDIEFTDPNAQHPFGQIVRDFAKPQDAAPDGSRATDRAIEDYGVVGQFATVLTELALMEFVGATHSSASTVLSWNGSATGMTDIELTITLDHTCPRIDLSIEITKGEVLDLEGVFISLPLGDQHARFHYDRPLNWIEPRVDHLDGSSNEWITLTNGARVDREASTVVLTSLDAPLITGPTRLTGAWPARFGDSKGHLYSFIFNNNWYCNAPPFQLGRTQFSFILDAVPLGASLAARKVLAVRRTPGLAIHVTQLDEFSEGRAPVSLVGTLWAGRNDDSVFEVSLATRDDDSADLTVKNLSGVDTTEPLELPEGLAVTQSGGRSIEVALSAHGWATVLLQRIS